MTQQIDSKVLYKRALDVCAAARVTCMASEQTLIRSQKARADSVATRLIRNSMHLKIFIDSPSYEYFIAHLSHHSICWAAINRAPLLGRTRVVECDEIEAHQLLLSARESCPRAIARISEAVRTARSGAARVQFNGD